MVIYGDILFILNMIIDYLLLGLTAVTLKTEARIVRRLIAAAVGGISSFYIFIESNIDILDLLFRLFTSVLIILLTFGFIKIRTLIKSVAVYYFFSIFLSGIAVLLSSVFKSKIIEVNNTYFYVGISPIMLIIVSSLVYFSLVLFFRIRKGSAGNEICETTLEYKGKCIFCKGLIDSGNSVTDIFSDSQIFISNEKTFVRLFNQDIEGFFAAKENADRCRIIPASTVSGNILLRGARCDKAKISFNNKNYDFLRPIIAVSSNFNNDDFDLIISKSSIEG